MFRALGLALANNTPSPPTEILLSAGSSEVLGSLRYVPDVLCRGNCRLSVPAMSIAARTGSHYVSELSSPMSMDNRVHIYGETW